MRRLRAKLGPEHESLIGTVRNVGYRFVTPEKVERAAEEAKNKADRQKASDADETTARGGAEARAKA
ncbi:DNA-binding response OmpR family regulator OS=Streptomyces griseomycini OX=66895 GN=FHS37_004505 PE=4 SV=1 [Streptomyces griseomycini]